MTRWLQSSFVACVVATGTLTIVPNALAQKNSLGAARDLYVAAAYDDALSILNGLRASERREEKGLVEQYRAFCLLALGRATEADSAIEAAVTAAPFTQPSESEVSPRVRSAFREVRRRVLPALIERQYTDAKAAFDRKDATAAEGFTQVLALIADPDLQSIANQPPLSQLRVMATDFLVLSRPKASPPPLLPRSVQPSASRQTAAPAVRDPSQIYGPDDAGVLPPGPVRQSFAPMAEVFSLRPGAVEIIVDETGTVIAVTTKVSVNAVYDRLALATAKSWRYRPAMLNGVAVKFRMIVSLQLPPKH
jgi:TonB family protein